MQVFILNHESLREYMGRIEEMRNHPQIRWEGKQEVTVLSLMKTLTFKIISCILIGLERGVGRHKLLDSFQEMILGVWLVKAHASIQNMVKDFIRAKREDSIK